MPRFIPLRIQERINRIAGRAVFDLSYYLRFEPSTLAHTGVKVALHPRRTEPATRYRVALVTPHLGPGGAERILLDLAESFDRNRFELFLIATHSSDSRWLGAWRDRVDHVHDLAAEYPPGQIVSALYSLVVNHAMRGVVLQNSLYGYAALPHLRTALPAVRIFDLIHAVGGAWDLASVVAPAAHAIDTRIVISETGARHLAGLGGNPDRIRWIPNGVDLDRFRPATVPGDGIFRILFAARLDPVKRPLMLPRIAAELERMGPCPEFRIVAAGDGPLDGPLRAAVEKAGLGRRFDFLGFVDDTAPLLAACEALLLTSSHEGVPLSILEAFASGRPVVAPDVGAIGDILDASAGFLVTDRDNPAAFARVLSTLMADPGRRELMGAAARRLAEQHYDRKRAQVSYRELWSALDIPGIG